MVRADGESWNVRDCHMADTLVRLVAHHGPDAKAVLVVSPDEVVEGSVARVTGRVVKTPVEAAKRRRTSRLPARHRRCLRAR